MYDNEGRFVHRPDLESAEFVLYQGVYPGHSGMGYQGLARKTVNAVKNNNTKITIVDPVMHGGTDIPEGTNWIPITPATDGAFVMGMLNWIFENEKYNKEFVKATTLEAGEALGFKSYTNASYLVITDEEHENYRSFLRASDIGLEGDSFIVLDPSTEEVKKAEETDKGKLFYEGEVEGVKVATSFSILKNQANKMTLEEYSQICNVPKEKIIEVAEDLTGHGHKVSVDTLGGTASLNGFPFATALFMIPAMQGAYNMKGGMVMGGGSHKAHSDGPRYNLATIENGPELSGAKISREGFAYEDTTEYKNKVAQGIDPYPTKLPWHPNGFHMDGQAIFSAINKYPYQAKVIINCAANPIYGGPAGYNEKAMEELKKTSNIPLFISIDTVIGETSAFADYLIPDTNYNEHWAILGARANHTTTITGVRWPVVEAPIDKVGDRDEYISMESYLIEIAKRIGIPGYGENAIVDHEGKSWPLNNREDYWMKAIANVAYDGDVVEGITDKDLKITGLDNIPKAWEEAVSSEELPLVKNIIAKGGKFAPDDDSYDGEFMKNVSTGRIAFYSENVAKSTNTITGEYNAGSPAWMPEMFANGDLINDVYPQSEYPFRICSAKAKLRGISMMSNSPTLQNLSPTNYIEINAEDAKQHGISDGQEIYIESAANKTNGIAKVRKGIAKGTLGVEFGYGKWEYGSRDAVIDGKTIEGDSDRGRGTATNQLGPLDPTVDGIVGVSEAVSGSPSRNSIRVRITPA